MDPETIEIFNFVARIFPFVAVVVVVSVVGALLNNWLKIKNGYPLSNSWGMPTHASHALGWIAERYVEQFRRLRLEPGTPLHRF